MDQRAQALEFVFQFLNARFEFFKFGLGQLDHLMVVLVLDHRDEVIGRAGTVATRMKWTSTVAFTVVGAYVGAWATATTGNPAAGAAGAAMFTTALSNAATQISEDVYDMRDGFSGTEFLTAVLTQGAINLLVGPMAGEASKALTGMLAKQLTARLGREISLQAVQRVLASGGGRFVRMAVTAVLTDGPKTVTPEMVAAALMDSEFADEFKAQGAQ